MASKTAHGSRLAIRNSYPSDTAGGSAPVAESGVNAGASGTRSSAMDISTGGFIALIVIVVAVSLIGMTTATLFFVAKKREWKIRERVRRSARKVVTALTPGRSDFPASAKESIRPSRRDRVRIAGHVPPTPRLGPEDPEKRMVLTDVKSKGRGQAA